MGDYVTPFELVGRPDVIIDLIRIDSTSAIEKPTGYLACRRLTAICPVVATRSLIASPTRRASPVARVARSCAAALTGGTSTRAPACLSRSTAEEVRPVLKKINHDVRRHRPGARPRRRRHQCARCENMRTHSSWHQAGPQCRLARRPPVDALRCHVLRGGADRSQDGGLPPDWRAARLFPGA